MILKTTFNYFLKFFMEAVFTGKEIKKNYFFLMIDADDFQITAGGDYSVPAVGHHGEFKISCPAAAERSGFRRFI
jgi:hypothetical protein